ncbi:MAG TPA: alpha/beta fold hydrolase [Candidatus Eisenbacteria bacterium]|nr:alpha/beta fold hydrolase [Candidatus Eisenbacteria bacterium]
MTVETRRVQQVTFPGPEGGLEGLWSDPGRGLPPAVICHPHPAHKGSMHSKVVHTVYRVLEEAGHATLRFNFRGVGRSEGSYSGWDGEVGDVAAAAAFARERTGIRPLWLAGFSFGSWVGAKFALADGQCERFLALGVPVTTNIDGRTFEFLDRPPAPMLIVQGSKDQYGSREGVLALAERLRAAGGPDRPVEVRFVENADHFFTGHLTQLAGALRDGLGLTEA